MSDDSIYATSANEDEAAREITLGTSSLLLLFFGLAVMCGVCFGLGYMLGGRKPTPLPGANGTPVNSVTQPNFSSFKPAAGSPMPAGSATISGNSAASGPAKSTPATAAMPPTETPETRTQPAPVERALPAAPAAATNGKQTYVVQVAAVSHQDVAELLTRQLKSQGFNVTTHSDPTDNLTHIQVGPFAARTDADAMRQKLLAAGYSAIIK